MDETPFWFLVDMASIRDLPTVPLASGWGPLWATWKRGEDVAPHLESLDWDSPVFVWGATIKDVAQSQLVHPLAYAMGLGDPAFSLMVVQAKSQHPWSQEDVVLTVKKTGESTAGGNPALPAMGDLWGWGLLEATLAHGNVKCLETLAPFFARSISKHRHDSSQVALAGEIVGKSGLSNPGELKWILETLETALAAVGLKNQLLRSQALFAACKAGRGETALALDSLIGGVVPAEWVFELANQGAYSAATSLMPRVDVDNAPQVLFHSSFGPRYERARSRVIKALTKPLTLLEGQDKRSSKALSKAGLRQKEEALAFIGATVKAFGLPISQGASKELSLTVCDTLAYAPSAFDALEKNNNRSIFHQDVIALWVARNHLHRPQVMEEVARFRKQRGEAGMDRAMELAIVHAVEYLGVDRQGPLARRVERMEALLQKMEGWAHQLGIDWDRVCRWNMPAMFNEEPRESQWMLVVKERTAQRLDEHFQAGSGSAPKVRL